MEKCNSHFSSFQHELKVPIALYSRGVKLVSSWRHHVIYSNFPPPSLNQVWMWPPHDASGPRTAGLTALLSIWHNFIYFSSLLLYFLKPFKTNDDRDSVVSLPTT